APLASMATISIQDDANMVRYRPLFELIKESALVDPIKKTQEQRWGRALIRWSPLCGALSTVEPDKGGLFVRWFVKGSCRRAFANWAQSGIHLVPPIHCPPTAEWPIMVHPVNPQQCGSG